MGGYLELLLTDSKSAPTEFKKDKGLSCDIFWPTWWNGYLLLRKGLLCRLAWFGGTVLFVSSLSAGYRCAPCSDVWITCTCHLTHISTVWGREPALFFSWYLDNFAVIVISTLGLDQVNEYLLFLYFCSSTISTCILFPTSFSLISLLVLLLWC